MTRYRWNKNALFGVLHNHLVDYPTPMQQSYWFGFGSLAGMMLLVQLITGIFLAMHYTPHIELAFSSIEHIMRDVPYGWFFRYVHANGASFFFIVVYLHLFRGLYYGSYAAPRHHLWRSGVALLFLMMATAFLGYVLPWGQMSFWGATVITNLLSAIPWVGSSIVEWLWGGFSVHNPTLNRFFSLHFVLPFVLVGLSGLHLILLHQVGSGNPLGMDTPNQQVRFYPYFYVKDLFGFCVLSFLFFGVIFFSPNTLGHPDNYIMAEPLVTPLHIVPEWYFLPFYAILRSIPDKLGGVLAMFAAIVCFALLPTLHTSRVRSTYFRPGYRTLFWLFAVTFVLLGWIGQKPAVYPFVQVGIACVGSYFTFFGLVPVLGKLENTWCYEQKTL